MNVIHRTVRLLTALLVLAGANRGAADGLRLGASVGVGSAYGQTYYELGGRVGYDVAFGLTPEVGVMFWDGATPSFVELSAGLTWYVPLPIIRPYVGGFYARDLISSGLPDQDALGVRGGIGLLGAGPASLNLGFAWERRLACSVSCDTWWPEASAGFSF